MMSTARDSLVSMHETFCALCAPKRNTPDDEQGGTRVERMARMMSIMKHDAHTALAHRRGTQRMMSREAGERNSDLALQ